MLATGVVLFALTTSLVTSCRPPTNDAPTVTVHFKATATEASAAAALEACGQDPKAVQRSNRSSELYAFLGKVDKSVQTCLKEQSAVGELVRSK